MEITTDFSTRLAEIMAERGLRQADVATMIGVAQGTVSGWLNGAVPQRRTAETLCEKLAISADWLLSGIGDSRRGKVKGSEKIRLGIVKPLVLSQTKSPKHLATNLRAIRGAMSLKAFAELVGISKPEVYERYENHRLPRPLIFQRIANSIGATVEEMLTPLTPARVKEIRADMVRVSKEIDIGKRPLTHRTRLVFMQARQDLDTQETRRTITAMLGLREIDSDTLSALCSHLERVTFDAPLELGRYYFPFFAAVATELNRRSEVKQ